MITTGLSTSADFQSYYNYDQCTSKCFLNLYLIPYAIGGAGVTPNGPDTGRNWQAGAVGSSVTYSGLPNDATTVILGSYQVGLNTTIGTIGDADTHSQAVSDIGMVSAALSTAATIFPEYSFVLAPAAAMLDFAGAMGGYTNSADKIVSLNTNSHLSGDGTVSEWSQVNNGSWNPNDNPNWGSNVFSQGYVIQTTLSQQDLTEISLGKVSVAASIDLIDSGGSVFPAAATGSFQAYSVAPAVSIGGFVYAYSGGPPVSNVAVTLQQTNSSGTITNFVEYTNSAGYWHFFALPGAQYSYSVSDPTSMGTLTGGATIPTATTALNQEGQNETALSVNLDGGQLSGVVENATTGAKLSGAPVQVWDTEYGSGNSLLSVTNSAGAYSIIYPIAATSSNPFTAQVSPPAGYPACATSESNLYPYALDQGYTLNFVLYPGCHGGGGCVAYGTPILTPTGYVPVQRLTPGETIDEFNTQTFKLTTGTVVSDDESKVVQILSVNNGLLWLTLTDQPIFIENNTFEGWLHDPQNLSTEDSILDASTGLWVKVVNANVVDVKVKVYDVVTNKLLDFVANGMLLDRKQP